STYSPSFPYTTLFRSWALVRGFSPSFSFLLPDAHMQDSLRLLPQAGAVLHTKYPARLAFFPQLCYNLCSFILTKRRRAATPSRMRTNRGRHTAHQRELPPQARRGASSPAHAPPPTTAERRGEPLPGAPVTAQREAQPAGGAIRVEPWSGPSEREQRRFIPCRLSAG